MKMVKAEEVLGPETDAPLVTTICNEMHPPAVSVAVIAVIVHIQVSRHPKSTRLWLHNICNVDLPTMCRQYREVLANTQASLVLKDRHPPRAKGLFGGASSAALMFSLLCDE